MRGLRIPAHACMRRPVDPATDVAMTGGGMEVWAFCGACDRWFYCERWFDDTAPAPTCPVCAGEPSAMVNQAACSSAEAADVRADVRRRRRAARRGLAGAPS